MTDVPSIGSIIPTEPAAQEAVAALPYEAFLSERQKIVEARQRVQQRTDSLVTAGAAGALVISMSFLEKIAPAPSRDTRPVLFLAWALLLCALGANLAATFMSQRAFDNALRAFDKWYTDGGDYEFDSRAADATRRLGLAGALLFVIGVALLAWFAYANIQFQGG